MLLSAPAFISKPTSAEAMSNRLDLYKSALKDPRVRALLDTISYAEGTSGPEGYRTMFTGKKFDTSQGWKHPDTVMRGGGYSSSAAGRYQMLTPTYQMAAKATGTSGFSPAEQDLQAVFLIDNRQALDPLLRGENISSVINQLAPEWASLPTREGKSAYDQPVKALGELEKYYQSRLDGTELPISIEKGVQSDKPKQGPPGPDTKSSYDPMLVAQVLQKQKQEEDKMKLLQSFMGRVNRAAELPKSSSIDVLGLLQQAYQPRDLME